MIKPPEGVEIFVGSERNLYALWSKLRDFDKLWSDDIRWDYLWFSHRILSPDSITLLSENGILMLTGIRENLYAGAHFAFWDKKLIPKTKLIKDCIYWAFTNYRLQRLEVMIPEYARALKRFIEKFLNFNFEGRMRNRMIYNGQLADVLIFSLLREEVQ